MLYYARPLGKLIEELERMPGIGPKSAQRLAFYILNLSESQAQDLIQAIADVKTKIKKCSNCFNFTDQDPCSICSDPRRDTATICVVESPPDVIAMESTGEYKGLYHVLHGLIDPINRVMPEQLTISVLIQRLKTSQISEVILATNPTIEGDITAEYIATLIKPLNIKVTRLARGLPVGTDLDYADQVTLTRALEGRREM